MGAASSLIEGPGIADSPFTIHFYTGKRIVYAPDRVRFGECILRGGMAITGMRLRNGVDGFLRGIDLL